LVGSETTWARSGASHGSIYHHFGSKEAVALTLYVEGMHDYQESVLRPVHKQRSVKNGIRALIGAHLDFVEANLSRSLFLTRMGMADASEEVEARIAEVNQEFFRAIHAWLQPAIERGQVIRVPAALYLPLILGPTTHYARHWLAHRLAFDRDEILDVLTDAAWKSIRV
jgi:AcrR family transcriptional regulator